MSFRPRLAFGAALLCALAVPLHAQGQGTRLSPAERQELMSHRLTMDNVKKMVDASGKLSELSQKDPKLGDVREGEEAKSLSELVTKMEALPPVKAAIASSGMTTRDYVLTMFELQMVHSAVALRQMGGDAAKGAEKLPVSAENVQFFTTHRTELDPLLKSMESDGSKGGE
ncbi:MAG TPA: hypothetical protein VIG08_06280 [Gemmatimonadales bacterium]